MGSPAETSFQLDISPRPVLLNLQGGRRNDPDTEPAFEAVELLRRHCPSKSLYSYTPESLEFIDEDIPGSQVNFFEVEITPKTIISLVTVNAYCGNDFILAAELMTILANSIERVIIVSSYPSVEPLRASQRYPELYYDAGVEVSPGVFQYAFGGILAERGLNDITEIIVPRPEYAHLGTDALTAATIINELFTTLGCSAELNNPQSSLMKTLNQLRQRYSQNAQNTGLW